MPIPDSEREWYYKHKVAPPTSEGHGTEEDIARLRTPMKPHTWRLEGNKLIGISEEGTFAQFIPTGYILAGTDSQGMPKLRKI